MNPDSYRQVVISGLSLMGERVYNHMQSKVANEQEWFHDVLSIMDKFHPGVRVDSIAWVDVETHKTGMRKRTDEGWIVCDDEVFQSRFF